MNSSSNYASEPFSKGPPDSQKQKEAKENRSEAEEEYSQRILKGASFIFSGSIIGKVVGFTLQLVLARGFGKALYGLYTIGLTVLRLGQSVATLGLQNGIVRFGAPQYESGNDAQLKGTFLIGGGLGLVSGMAIGLGLFLMSSWLALHVFADSQGVPNAVIAHTVAVFGVGLPFYVLTYLASRMARAMGKMQVDTLLDSILQPAYFLVLVGVVLLLGESFTLALYAFLVSTVLAAGTGIYAIYHLFPPLLSNLSPEVDLRALLRFSLPVVGVTLATMGLTYTDRLMLGILGTAEAVGLYQAAAVLSTQTHFVSFAVTAAFSPLISDLYHSGRLDDLSTLYANTVRWTILFTLPGAAVLFLFAPEIISLWGSEFEKGVPALRILTVAHFIVAGAGSVGQMLQMSDHQDFVFGVNAFTAVLNVILNWILIRRYGALGAALATGFSQALGDLIETGGLYYFLSLHPFRWNLWKPLAAGGLAGAGTWPLYVSLSGPAEWAIGIPAFMLAYGGILYLLRLHPQDQAIIKGLWAHSPLSS
jgi:O-antigen/teichoic acid export membrane protein